MTTSHLTNPAAEELLAGHPKGDGQVVGMLRDVQSPDKPVLRLSKRSGSYGVMRVFANLMDNLGLIIRFHYDSRKRLIK